jgi:hypothetical protein
VHEVNLRVGVRGVTAPGPRQDDDEAEDNRNGDEEMESIDHWGTPSVLRRQVFRAPFLRDRERDVALLTDSM